MLEERELEPFRAVVQAGIACVMTSHVVVTAIDPDRPSTFSPTVLGDVLRGRLGFDGVIISDALDMAGASAETGIPEAAVRALAAGCDLLCIGSDTTEEQFLEVVETVLAAVESGRLAEARVADAAQRVDRLRRAYAPSTDRGAPGPSPTDLWSDGVVEKAFSISRAAREWLALEAPPAIVQVSSESNLAVGEVAWGPEAAGLTTPATDVPAGAKVAVVGRALSADHPLWRTAQTLRAQGHPTIVVESGWPRGDADVVTYGGSPVVAQALGRLLGVTPA